MKGQRFFLPAFTAQSMQKGLHGGTWDMGKVVEKRGPETGMGEPYWGPKVKLSSLGPIQGSYCRGPCQESKDHDGRFVGSMRGRPQKDCIGGSSGSEGPEGWRHRRFLRTTVRLFVRKCLKRVSRMYDSGCAFAGAGARALLHFAGACFGTSTGA